MAPLDITESERRAGLLARIWGQWWLVTLGWWAASICIIEALKHARHKLWLSVFGNLVVGWPLVAPLALYHGWDTIRVHCSKLLLVALLGGLEMNLGNLSLYHIGAALGTAMNGFNIVFTFFISSLFGADESGFMCITRFKCFTCQNLLLTFAIWTLFVGGIVTAVLGNGSWRSTSAGVILKLLSSLAYAFRFTLIKLLFGSNEPARHKVMVARPSKFQLAFFANPMVGLIALGLTPVYEPALSVPPALEILAVAGCGTLILLFEFRLTELTSPLTVAVLAVAHSFVIVLWLALRDRGPLGRTQVAGFGISMLGSALYAVSKNLSTGHAAHQTSGRSDASCSDDEIGSEASSAAAGTTSSGLA